MLRNQTPNPANPIVKLFPRLAPAVIAHEGPRRTTTAQRTASQQFANANPYQDEHAQVRARLLRMILDNERSRRYDNRPNAS